MTKKCYLAPEAELLMLIPEENLATNWFWGTYDSGSNGSITSIDVMNNAWDFTQDKDSYQIKN